MGGEPTQLRRVADVIEARLHFTQEEIEQATKALKKVQKLIIDKRRVAQQEKVSLQANFEEEKAQIQQEREQLLAEQVGVKEVVSRALHSMTCLDKKEEDLVEYQVEKLVEAIQQLQKRIANLELRIVPSTP